jgi:hypothetical protein
MLIDRYRNGLVHNNQLKEANVAREFSMIAKDVTWLIGAVFAASVMTIQPTFAQDNTHTCGERELVKAGTYEGTIKGVGLIVGARWGSGTVTLNDGKTIPISFKGGKLFDIGAAETKMEGTVYNLDKIEDLPGTYLGVGGGLTAATAGLGGASITNGKCVVLNGTAKDSEGLRASLPIGPGGIEVSVDEK